MIKYLAAAIHPVGFWTLMLQVLDMGNAGQRTGVLYYAVIFLVIALLAGALGFLALAGLAALIARVMFVLFLVFFLISLVRRRRL